MKQGCMCKVCAGGGEELTIFCDSLTCTWDQEHLHVFGSPKLNARIIIFVLIKSIVNCILYFFMQ